MFPSPDTDVINLGFFFLARLYICCNGGDKELTKGSYLEGEYHYTITCELYIGTACLDYRTSDISMEH